MPSFIQNFDTYVLYLKGEDVPVNPVIAGGGYIEYEWIRKKKRRKRGNELTIDEIFEDKIAKKAEEEELLLLLLNDFDD